MTINTSTPTHIEKNRRERAEESEIACRVQEIRQYFSENELVKLFWSLIFQAQIQRSPTHA